MLQVPAALLGDYLHAVLRLWVTELRPRWRPDWLGDLHGCSGSVVSMSEQGNQLLLAALTLPIVPPSLGSASWTVTKADDVVITEDARPLLLHLRLLQECLFAGAQAAGDASPVATAAAGVLNADGTATSRSVVNGLNVLPAAGVGTQSVTLTLTFNGYNPPPSTGGPQYLIKALLWPSGAPTDIAVQFQGFQANGFQLLLRSSAAITQPILSAMQLMVEVSVYA
jgi:hypothetical protein